MTPARTEVLPLLTQDEHAAMRWKPELPDRDTQHYDLGQLGSNNASWRTPLVRAEGSASISKSVFCGLRAAA